MILLYLFIASSELNFVQFENVFEERQKNLENAILGFDGLDEIGVNPERFQTFLNKGRMFGNDPSCIMSAMFVFISHPATCCQVQQSS